MYFQIAAVELPVWLPILWGVLIGLVFSTVGAAGGILASVGLVSVMGVENPNLIKPMAQALTLATPLVAVPMYCRQCRVVISLAVLLGLGGVVGALIGSSLSVTYLSDLKTFKPVFGALVLLIAAQTGWRLLRSGAAGDNKSSRASQAFEGMVVEGGDVCTIGVQHTQRHWRRVAFSFGGEQFSFRPVMPFIAGMLIAIVSSALGVGGGFLLVPFMTALMGLPMFIVAATAALAVAVSSVTSIANYLRLGIELDIPLLVFMLAGTLVGAFIGPRLSKHLNGQLLNGILGVVLLLIGLRYLNIF